MKLNRKGGFEFLKEEMDKVSMQLKNFYLPKPLIINFITDLKTVE
jgi:hypothetical protein